MKHFFIITIIMLQTVFLSAKWINLTVDPAQDEYNAIAKASESDGVVVGANGSIYKIDINTGGVLSWQLLQYDYYYEDLNDIIYDESENRYVAVGDNGEILISNFGYDWENISIDTDIDLEFIFDYKNEYFVFSKNKLYELDWNSGILRLLDSLPNDINEIIHDNDTELLMGVGDRGMAFSFDGKDITYHDLGIENNISTITDIGDKILITPWFDYVHEFTGKFENVRPYDIDTKFELIGTMSRMGNKLFIFGAKAITEALYVYDIDNDTLITRSFRHRSNESIALDNYILVAGQSGAIRFIDTEANGSKDNISIETIIMRGAPSNIIGTQLFDGELLVRQGNKLKKIDFDELTLIDDLDVQSVSRNIILIERQSNDYHYFSTRMTDSNFIHRLTYNVYENGIHTIIDSSSLGSQNNHHFFDDVEHSWAISGTAALKVSKSSLELEKIDLPYPAVGMDYDNGIFYLLSSNKIYTSADLTDWNYIDSIDNGLINDIAVNNGTIYYIKNHRISFQEEEVIIHEYGNNNPVYIYPKIERRFLSKFTAVDSLLAFAADPGVLVYSHDNGKTWNIDDLETEDNIREIIKYRDILIAYGNTYIFAKHIDNEPFGDIEEVHFGNLLLYPNPSPQNPAVSISGLDITGKAEYTIFDITGKILKSGIAEGNKLNIQGLNSGSYIVFLESNNQSYAAHLRIE